MDIRIYENFVYKKRKFIDEHIQGYKVFLPENL